MSRYMTQEEIDAEQELIRQQAASPRPEPRRISYEEAVALGMIPQEGISDEQADHATPMDLLHSENYVDRETRDVRFNICKGCDRLFKPTRTCKECGCFMALKTWLKTATCALPEPDRKW